MNLKEFLSQYKKPLLAFSGGADSTYLLYKMKEFCPDFVAVTVIMPNSAKKDLLAAEETEKKLNIQIIKIDYNPIKISRFAENDRERCFYCKTGMYWEIIKVGKELCCDGIFDGTNSDDTNTYRPGRKAAKGLNIISPLELCCIGKKEILSSLKENGIIYKGSNSCYATRIPYGEAITTEKITIIQKAETFILDFGVSNVRCGLHGNIIRIDVPECDLEIIFKNRKKIVEFAKQFNINYFTLDLEGFISGKQDRL